MARSNADIALLKDEIFVSDFKSGFGQVLGVVDMPQQQRQQCISPVPRNPGRGRFLYFSDMLSVPCFARIF